MKYFFGVHSTYLNILLSTFISLSLYGSQNLIEKLEVKENRIDYTINPQFKEAYLLVEPFVEYDEDVNVESMHYAITSLPALMNLYSLVWISGKDYYVDSMDKEVYESLKRLKEMFRCMYPDSTWSGNIVPREIVSLSSKFREIHERDTKGMLFSGGLDSTSSLYEHKDEDLVLISAQGFHDTPLDKPKEWKERKEYITNLARTFGQESTFLRSNALYTRKFFKPVVSNDLYHNMSSDWRFATLEGMSWAGVTAPISIAKKCSHLYLPSSLNWYYTKIGLNNPIIEQAFVFLGFKLLTDQFELTRHDKVKFIVDICKKMKLFKPTIKACHMPNSNCGYCRKCCMTMISLLGLGEKLSEYGYNFTDEEAVKNTIAYLTKESLYSGFTSWSYQELQIRLKRLKEKSLLKNQNTLKPYLDFDMKQLKIRSRRGLIDADNEALLKIAQNVTISLPDLDDEELLKIVV